MARSDGEHFKQKDREHAGLSPRLTDNRVTGLVSQGRVARPWGGEATGGCRATNPGERQADLF